jgi:hypothetical protein
MVAKLMPKAVDVTVHEKTLADIVVESWQAGIDKTKAAEEAAKN